MLPRPKAHKASNSLAVKVAALARQRVRAQRNSSSINNLRRSSIMPGLRNSHRQSSIGGRDHRFSSTNHRDSLVAPRSRRSSVLRISFAPVDIEDSRRSSIAQRGYGNGSGNGSGNGRRSSSVRQSIFRHEVRRSSIFMPSVGGRRSSLVGGAVPSTMVELENSLQSMSVVENEEEDDMREEDDMKEIEEEISSSTTTTSFSTTLSTERRKSATTSNHNTAAAAAAAAAAAESSAPPIVVAIDVAVALQFVLEFCTMREMRSSTMMVDRTWSRSTVSSMSWSIGSNVVQPNYQLQRLPPR